jgi:hypothetical protein
MYEVYGAKNYNYIKNTMEAIKQRFDGDKGFSLRGKYDNAIGVFPCRTFNLAKQSASIPHTDHNNLAQGWCSITALGDFNPTQGGHLVLWDLGIVVEFPSNSTILIPSSLIVHSNIPIQPDEVRYSIVQYAAGHLFRWAQNGFLTNKQLLDQSIPKELEQWEKGKIGRWESAVASFTTLEELDEISGKIRAKEGKRK